MRKSVDPALKEEIRKELTLRVNAEYYGHISPDEPEQPKVIKQYLILAGEFCPSCEQAMEEFAKEIEKGEIEVLNTDTSDKAMEIIMQLGVYALPALFGEDGNGKYYVLDSAS